ncbi:M23 family metallopeptidase [Sphingomonas sp. CROZ-RG-20F-R02-07]|uniref:M23 family metallopeptidase n=1 Tax=Sphingomonas sp. CROZ-RG-20F-R02-07 TaxID=2914832 RepID=UPI003221C195
MRATTTVPAPGNRHDLGWCGVFLRDETGVELAGGTNARGFGRALAVPTAPTTSARFHGWAAQIDWVPDLGMQVGTRTWWRGLATCTALCAATWALSPGFDRPLPGLVPAPLSGAAWEEGRAQGIAPLAWGGDTGRHMAANDLVRPLAEAPERPSVDLAATLGEGDTFDHALVRAGVGRADAQAAAALIAQAVPLADIPSGTRIALTLGRRSSRTVPRPLDRLELRARFDLALGLARTGGTLAMQRQPIAVDATPLRLQGLVGASLYRAARAAGAPAKVVESFIRALATKMSVGRDIGASDRFDLIVERERAATGETRIGQLLFAGIDQGAHAVRLVRFGDDANTPWYDANGQSETEGQMGMPVAGHVTSGFGMRFHPILGFTRMHKGIDIGAPWGTPIYAVVDGQVQFAGRTAGYGNFIKLAHGGGLATGYGHLSRIAVAPGSRVVRGQVIGYVGSTGMSTGPHLHWEVWRGGVAINPATIAFSQISRLSGERLRAFKARVADLLAVKVGG